MLFFYPLRGKTQSNKPLVFDHLTVENGLSQNSVLYITQDKKGFLWYGTRYGLDRYDGVHCKVYKHNPKDSATLSDNYITALMADSKGYLWVGSATGLDRYDPLKDAFIHIFYDHSFAPQGKYFPVTCLEEDQLGNIWVGTPTELGLIPAGEQKIARTFHFGGGASPVGSSGSAAADGRANNVRTIFEDAHHAIWVGTENGLIRMSPAEGGTYKTQTYRHDPAVTGSLSDSYITSIAEDRAHRLWIGTQNGGINQWDEDNLRFVPYTQNKTGLLSNNIRKILVDPNGKLWIGTLEGLSIFDPASKSFASYQHDPNDKKSLSQNSIYSIYQDQNGSVWIGTYFGGVNVTYAYQTPFYVYQCNKSSSSINNNVVSGITEDESHNLWLGTEGGGLNYFNRRTGLFTVYKNIPGQYNSLGSNLVKVIYRDARSRIWVGTHGGGLNLFHPENGTFSHLLYTPDDEETINSEINAVLLDSAGHLWVGTQNGLKFFKEGHTGSGEGPGGWVATAPLFAPQAGQFASARALLEDSRKNVWIGFSTGLYKYDPHAATCTRINTATINCIKEDSKGRIWVGAYFEGISCYDPPSGKWTTYTTADGLPNDNVIGILEDNEGLFWLSTDNGLSCLDATQGLFKNYTRTDGLAANEFNYHSFYKSDMGELFFGGYNGVTAFYPDQIQTNQTSSSLIFTALKLFNQEVPVTPDKGLLRQNIAYTDGLVLPYNENVFTLQFALLNFVKSDKNNYAYKLVGFDKDWHYTSDPQVSYMNLPSGHYTLAVKGSNNDGIWSEPITMAIAVLPPIWDTWWAWCLYLIFTASVLFLVIRFFWIRTLLRKDHALNQAKLNFFTNVSHEIRTRLTLISGPIEHILSGKEDSLLSRQLQHVKQNADRLLFLVEELMDFRKAETQHLRLHVMPLNVVDFARDIFVSFGDLSASRRIHTDFIASEEEIIVWFDPIQMEKVICNLLSNAFKFTQEGGYISLTLEYRKGNVELRVTDNGKGIAPEHIQKLFTNYFQADDKHTQNTGYGIGLALSKRIVQLHKGQLSVESQLGPEPGANRTCFTLMLLSGNEHYRAEELEPAPTGASARLTPTNMASTAAGAARRLGAAVAVPVGMVAPSPAVGKPTLLIAEDNAEVRAFIVQMLCSRYVLLEAPNGVKGVEIAVREIPDLIISDIMMPEMDGLAFCETIKSDPRTNHIPLILLTAKTASEHLIHGLEKGADVYLTKPFSLQVLELHIRNLLAAAERIRAHYGSRFGGNIPPSSGHTGPGDRSDLGDRNGINGLDDRSGLGDRGTMAGLGDRSGLGDPGTMAGLGDRSLSSEAHETFLVALVEVIETHLDNPDFDVPLLSTKMAMSQSVLYKKVKATTDMSVGDFIRQIRFRKAAQLLQENQLSVYEVAYSVGFNDSKYFSREFKKQFGKTPSEYARSAT